MRVQDGHLAGYVIDITVGLSVQHFAGMVAQ